MTYQEVRTRLLELSAKVKTDGVTFDETREARRLVGLLIGMGISPRRVRLSLRELGLGTRAVDKFDK
jgi:hypothetical protein